VLCVCVQGALGSSNEILRCAAGEALGRIVQVVAENKFIADMAQYSFDRLLSFIHWRFQPVNFVVFISLLLWYFTFWLLNCPRTS